MASRASAGAPRLLPLPRVRCVEGGLPCGVAALRGVAVVAPLVFLATPDCFVALTFVARRRDVVFLPAVLTIFFAGVFAVAFFAGVVAFVFFARTVLPAVFFVAAVRPEVFAAVLRAPARVDADLPAVAPAARVRLAPVRLAAVSLASRSAPLRAVPVLRAAPLAA
ncbi:MAG: hypothetical protein HOQ02_12440, partial [Lysobacter sp.]|nr:hypothetical protein [Lysobacter sp.]